MRNKQHIRQLCVFPIGLPNISNGHRKRWKWRGVMRGTKVMWFVYFLIQTKRLFFARIWSAIYLMSSSIKVLFALTASPSDTAPSSPKPLNERSTFLSVQLDWKKTKEDKDRAIFGTCSLLASIYSWRFEGNSEVQLCWALSLHIFLVIEI